MPKPTSPGSQSDNSQLAGLVIRLQEFLAEYLTEAENIGLRLTPAKILSAIDEAIRRCETKDIGQPTDESAEAFFLDGISAALVEEQQGVYEKQKNADGEEVYMVVSDTLWLACLKALRNAANGNR